MTSPLLMPGSPFQRGDDKICNRWLSAEPVPTDPIPEDQLDPTKCCPSSLTTRGPKPTWWCPECQQARDI